MTRLSTARMEVAPGLIHPVFRDTPLYHCDALGALLNCTGSIKLETANPAAIANRCVLRSEDER